MLILVSTYSYGMHSILLYTHGDDDDDECMDMHKRPNIIMYIVSLRILFTISSISIYHPYFRYKSSYTLAFISQL